MKKLGIAGIALALMTAATSSAFAESHTENQGMSDKKPPRGERMMKKFDTDGDGSISKAEFEQMQDSRKTFEEMDRNGDGVLNREDRKMKTKKKMAE